MKHLGVHLHLCSPRTLHALQKAAKFDSDFAPLERAIRYAALINGDVLTPEQMVIELDLTPARLREMEMRTNLRFGCLASAYEILARHSLFPAARTTWGEWLVKYRDARRKHARARSKFQQANLRAQSVWSTQRAARYLRVTSQTIVSWYWERRLCGLRRLGEHRIVFPSWQFDAQKRCVRRGVLTALSQMHRDGSVDDWVVCAFFLTKLPVLAGRAPISLPDDKNGVQMLARLPVPHL